MGDVKEAMDNSTTVEGKDEASDDSKRPKLNDKINAEDETQPSSNDRDNKDTSVPQGVDSVDAKGDTGGVDECGRDVDGPSQMSTTGDQGSTPDFNVKKFLPSCFTSTKVSTDPDTVDQHKEVESTTARISRQSDVYDMDKKSMGHALIINQETFSVELRRQGYSRRTGTGLDERAIHRRLKDLGFQVASYPDLNANQIMNVCAKFSNMDHSDCNAFICVILSHGEEGVVFATDKPVEITDMSAYFKGDRCPSLVGKPKLFIIQACRGQQTDPGVDVAVIPKDVTDGPVKPPLSVKLPVEADFLFAYSTVPGYYSWRNGANGSWFIQSLCAILENTSGPIEIRKLLTLVNKKVAQSYRSWNPENQDFHKMKQVPCLASMLTRDFFLTPKKKRW